MTIYNVDVTWNDLHMGFTEVTGLDRFTSPAAYF